MRAAFSGQLTRIYQKVSERDGQRVTKLVAEVLVVGDGDMPSEVITATLAPEQSPSVPAGRVSVTARLTAWSVGGRHGLAVTAATLESLK